MAFVHGKDSYVAVDDSGGTLRDLSSYVTGTDFSQAVDAAETTTYGVSGGARTFIAGLKDATVSIQGNWDSTADGYLAGALGQTGTVTYGPNGSTSGRIKYTMEALMTSYDLGDPVDGVVTWTAEFQVSGAVTRTTF